MTPQTEASIREFSATSEGWTRTDRALELAELVLEIKPQRIVEIGTFAGGSLIPQALALKELGQGQIFGIDPWRTEYAVEGEEGENAKWWQAVDLHQMHRLTMEAIWRYELDPYAIVIRAPSQYCASLFFLFQIDILNIDGSHSEEASCRDVDLYLPSVVSDGYIWMDDILWVDASRKSTTTKAISMLEAHCNLIKDAGNYRLYQKHEPAS